jgi:hypothetical protein
MDVKGLCTCRVNVNGVTPLCLVLNEDAVRHLLYRGYRVLDTTVRAWSGFNALIEAPSRRVPGAWSTYLARFEPRGIEVAAHPEAVIGRTLDEALQDELLNWRRAKPLADAAGRIVAVSIETGTQPVPPAGAHVATQLEGRHTT